MTTPEPPADTPEVPRRREGASDIGIGILASRILGVGREMLRAQYLGATIGIVGDAWTTAIRIPNLLQNLLGEGALSAAFIPVYSRLRAEGEEEEAGKLAGAIAAILALVLAVAVALGVIFAPQIVQLIAPKACTMPITFTPCYTPHQFALTVQLTRILFPGAAIFVFAAWCIGILSAHQRFRLAYIAPVFWNLTMIAAFLWFGRRLGDDVEALVRIVAWASVVGAGMQFLAQFPTVLRLATHLRFRPDHRRESVRKVLKGFGPIAISRGAVQISSFIDLSIALKLPQGAATLLMTAQTVTLLPISIFGMAISNAELPGMSSVLGTSDERHAALRDRLKAAARRISYFVIPCAVAFAVLGDVIIRVLYERGLFKPIDTMFTWGILACAAAGLLANTLARLYSTAFYAMNDTKRPFRIALIRIVASVTMGYLAAVPLTNALGVDRHWGAAALSLAASAAGWLEFTLLRRGLRRQLGDFSVPVSYAFRVWAAAGIAALVALGVEMLSNRLRIDIRPVLRHLLDAALVLGTFGLVYLALTVASRLPEANALVSRFRRR